tara:strand:+ start:198 stop:707 length:510 start_codon:yes stop_codon:yes gene_type:complete
MQEHSLAINYDLGVNTVTDCLPADTFDVSALKKESPNGPVMDVAPGDAQLDARAQELSAIEDFIAKHGVSVPTAEDFKPKKQSWRGKKSKKTDKQVAQERRGRPRTKYTKTMTFVLVSDFQGLFKKSRGRGRAKAGDIRLKFDIHHTHVDVASRGFWTIEQLQAMGAAG